jgi:hypothetical protein
MRKCHTNNCANKLPEDNLSKWYCQDCTDLKKKHAYEKYKGRYNAMEYNKKYKTKKIFARIFHMWEGIINGA